MITKGTEVRVIGDVFPNVRGFVVAVVEDRVDLTFRAYYTVKGIEHETWEMVSLPLANVVEIDLTEKDEPKEMKEVK